MFARPPCWVSAPTFEAGSIDPLGYQAEVDSISNRILPGVTVFTTRIRYLSFLAWALGRTRGDKKEIDLWDIALSVGEYRRHRGEDHCKYPGVLLLKRLDLAHRDKRPSKLHNPPVRTRYMGLLRSCRFVDNEDELTDRGDELANHFGRKAPKSLPKRIAACEKMPCLSEAGRVELKRLRQEFLEADTAEAQRRRETLHEIGKKRMRFAASDGAPRALLHEYLHPCRDNETAKALHDAAVLELEALPRTLLFHFLYKYGDELQGKLPNTTKLVSPYSIPSVEDDKTRFLFAIASHLQCAERMGGRVFQRDLDGLKRDLFEQHLVAKPDGPWVDERWRQLRKGLAPENDAWIHGFRLRQFASLLKDLDNI